MPINSKKKGSGFERKIANLLSKRFDDGSGITQLFRRNADSGSYFGGTNVQRTQTHSLDYAVFGDLICPRNFKFSIECKFYKTAPSFQSIVEQKVTQWDGWLVQAEQDATSAGKSLALIVKYNKVNEIVFLKFPLNHEPKFLNYNQYHIYSLDKFLRQDNSLFFDTQISDTQT